MEQILLKHFHKHLYELSYSYYCDQYSSQCYNSEIREQLSKTKALKDVLDEIGITYETNYNGYCGYEIDLNDLGEY